MKYVCTVCGWEYDESAGYPEGGIAPGTPWSEVPEDFECPLCGVGIMVQRILGHFGFLCSLFHRSTSLSF